MPVISKEILPKESGWIPWLKVGTTIQPTPTISESAFSLNEDKNTRRLMIILQTKKSHNCNLDLPRQFTLLDWIKQVVNFDSVWYWPVFYPECPGYFLLAPCGLTFHSDLVPLYLLWSFTSIQSKGNPGHRTQSEKRTQPENPSCTEGPQTSTDQTHLQQLTSYHRETEDTEEMEGKGTELNFCNIQ